MIQQNNGGFSWASFCMKGENYVLSLGEQNVGGQSNEKCDYSATLSDLSNHF